MSPPAAEPLRFSGLVGSILAAATEAQGISDAMTIRMAGVYKQDNRLSCLPVPRSLLSGLEVETQVAVRIDTGNVGLEGKVWSEVADEIAQHLTGEPASEGFLRELEAGVQTASNNWGDVISEVANRLQNYKEGPGRLPKMEFATDDEIRKVVRDRLTSAMIQQGVGDVVMLAGPGTNPPEGYASATVRFSVDRQYLTSAELGQSGPMQGRPEEAKEPLGEERG